MRRTVFTVIVAATLTTPVATAQSRVPTTNVTVQQVLANVQTLNAGTRTFSATFTQDYLAHAYNTHKTSNGSVTIAGMLSDWSYVTPAGQRIVSNATDICVYQPAEKQIYKQSTNQSQYPVIALLMQSNFASHFTFTLAAGSKLGGYVLEGTPMTPTVTYEKVLVYVDAQTFEIRRVMILDAQQNQNRFDFTNMQRNAPNVTATFAINAPPNVTFVGPGKTTTPPATCP
jgi:outer membrane lipoprotein carrier protein